MTPVPGLFTGEDVAVTRATRKEPARSGVSVIVRVVAASTVGQFALEGAVSDAVSATEHTYHW